MKNITIRSLRAKQKSDPKDTKSFFRKSKNKTEKMEETRHSRSVFKRLISFITLFIFVLVIGGIGGILTDRFAIPYLLVNYPQLNQYEFLKQVNERTTVIEITKEIEISEDKAVIETIKSALPVVVQIVEPLQDSDGKLNGEFARRGTGIILTSDGIIIASVESINLTAEKEIVSEEEEIEEKNEEGIESNDEINSGVEKNLARVKLNNGKIYSAELIAEDVSTGFAIIKIDETNLPVLPVAAFNSVEIGEKVVALDDAVMIDIVSKFVNNSEAVKSGAEEKIEKRIRIMNSLDKSFNGAPVMNLKREIIGISQSGNLIVPMDEVMALMNEAMSK